MDRVLEQYDPVEGYLRVLCLEDPSRTNDKMLNTISNKFTRVYLEFMSFTLTFLTNFNKLFQSEYPLLYKLKSETETLLKSLCSNFLTMVTIKTNNILLLDHTNPRNFVPLEKIYLGVSATQSLESIKEEDYNPQVITQFLKTCLEFYIELVTQIKKRFKFDDDIYTLIDIVDPMKAQTFEIKSLQQVLVKFPILKNFVDEQQLDNEWRRHALLDFEEMNLTQNIRCPEEYWQSVFDLKNAAGTPVFTNLQVVIHYFLVLPFSNASVERIFSELNQIKTSSRNCLNTNTISSILYSKQSIIQANGIVQFEPTRKMLDCKIWNKNNE